MKRLLYLLFIFSTVGGSALAQGIRVDQGNLYYDPPEGPPRQLTLDSSVIGATLSPNRQLVAFVRATARGPIGTGSGESAATDLWVASIDGTPAKRMVEADSSDDMKHVLAGLDNLQFSPDGRTLFFMSDAWATSRAIHALDLATGRERFVCSGNSLEVIQAGRYLGDLIVEQHRYREDGSYDWVWLISPEGKEVALVGDPESSDFETRLAELRGSSPPN